jgi:hypothetical protein
VGLIRLASIETTASISSTSYSKRIAFSLLLLKEVAFKAWFWGLGQTQGSIKLVAEIPIYGLTLFRA